ncbi:hypothetical protein EVAR_66536_1 [Eumeta japonica]|uniref:Uncharacterized protein n=1 Tax=Eumeta variegata TaxID=151549 RepID=A0A4C1Z7H7_EUMVA|nr:hypothetical protein EVAR_66536_1 [Eumeta japonica]
MRTRRYGFEGKREDNGVAKVPMGARRGAGRGRSGPITRRTAQEAYGETTRPVHLSTSRRRRPRKSKSKKKMPYPIIGVEVSRFTLAQIPLIYLPIGLMRCDGACAKMSSRIYQESIAKLMSLRDDEKHYLYMIT